MWKMLFQSVRGPAHERGGLPCQDHCLVRLRRSRHGPVLILACSDGAGSATHADLGARLACQGIVEQVIQTLARVPLVEIDREVVISWLAAAHDNLLTAAGLHETEPSQFACTLLLAVIGEHAAVFAQIGDGAIVVGDGDGYRVAFWPQSGEYANSTNFLTDAEWCAHLDFSRHVGLINEAALLTDGVQGLALNLASKKVHGPFFRPMFERLHVARPGQGLPQALRRFLESPAVTARSDDDKTLILATRVPPSVSTPVP